MNKLLAVSALATSSPCVIGFGFGGGGFGGSFGSFAGMGNFGFGGIDLDSLAGSITGMGNIGAGIGAVGSVSTGSGWSGWRFDWDDIYQDLGDSLSLADNRHDDFHGSDTWTPWYDNLTHVQQSVRDTIIQSFHDDELDINLCADADSWYGRWRGRHCGWYAHGDRCARHGTYRRFGLSANEACCACKTGRRLATPDGNSSEPNFRRLTSQSTMTIRLPKSNAAARVMRSRKRLEALQTKLADLPGAQGLLDTCDAPREMDGHIQIACTIHASKKEAGAVFTKSSVAPIVTDLALGFDVRVVIDPNFRGLNQAIFLGQLVPSADSELSHVCSMVRDKGLLERAYENTFFSSARGKFTPLMFADEKVCPE